MVELEKKRDPMWEDRSYDYKSKRCNEMLQEMVDLRKLEKKRDPMWEDRPLEYQLKRHKEMWEEQSLDYKLKMMDLNKEKDEDLDGPVYETG